MKAVTLLVFLFLIGDLAQVRQSSQIVERVPDAWVLTGSNPDAYAVGVTTVEVRAGARSAFITSRGAEPLGFGSLAQTVTEAPIAGRTVRMTGFAKASDVSLPAGLWLRFDDADGRNLVLESMEQHPIKGSRDWTRYEIALDAPPEAAHVVFGVLLLGSGTVYVDDFEFQVLDSDGAPRPQATAVLMSAARNLDFEE